MASNNRLKNDFNDYYENKFGKNEKINQEQAWKLFNKFCKKRNKNGNCRDSSEDQHKHRPNKSHSKERRTSSSSSSSK